MIRGLFSLYSPQYPTSLVYMLQNTEYRPGRYLKWYWRTNNFDDVMYRRTLDKTRAARLLLLSLRLGIVVLLLMAAWLIWLGYWQFGLGLAIGAPLLVAHLVIVPLWLGRWLVVAPRERSLVKQSEKIFRNHPGEKIAIAGSYGKTSMKELLSTVLSEGKQVVATPANKNVAISHAAFARGLTGQEEVVLIEYGEGAPGDVAKFAATTHPTRAVITGVAPAHLDRYKTLEQAAEDIFSVGRFVEPEHVYVNEDSAVAKEHAAKEHACYSARGALGWKVRDVRVSLEGTYFTMIKGKKKLHLASGLLGRHQVGPLVFAAALADELGLSATQVEGGIAKTIPFEHRMQPYPLAGAWVIDDTYNGNIEGIRAGTALLKELPAKRKIYATPGLVDQGVETERVHLEMGELIAGAKPDQVVLMQNSVTKFIRRGLKKAGYKGEVHIMDDPLAFYTSLQLVVAAGDVIMLQNDWTDNYY